MTKWIARLALMITALSAGGALANDWREGVKIWKVEPFFGAWVVVADDSFAFNYKSNWKWLAVREAKRLSAQHGGEVRILGENASKEKVE